MEPGGALSAQPFPDLEAVDRRVSALERDGHPVRAVTLSRSYATTVEDLWDAVTNGERIPRWFLPVSGDLEPGGRYQLEDNAGGVITACEPPSLLALTWEFGGDVSWVEARTAEDRPGRARFSLTHIQRPSAHWDRYGPGATGVGWEMGLIGLGIHVEQPTEPMADVSVFATAAGKAFITDSSEAWRKAAVAGGADPEAADARARRTTAFYTGESA